MPKAKSHKDCSKKKVYEPRCGHDECWDSYFDKNPAKFAFARVVYAKFGAEIFERTSGKKYRKHLERNIEKRYGK